MGVPKRGDWVLIHSQTLASEERAPQVPSDTKKIPLEMWIKGTLVQDGQIGAIVEIRTVTGRFESGTLLEVNPVYRHSFGEFVPQILEIGNRLQEALYGGAQNE